MEDLEMDAALWSQLPEALVVHVLTRLDILAFFRLRCVCKKWADLVRDGDFVQTHAAESHSREKAPLLVAYVEYKEPEQHTEFAAYSPKSNSWRTLPTSLFPSNSERQIVGSAGGFLLLESVEGEPTLYVYNPLSKSERQLPRLHLKSSNSRCRAWIVVNELARGYNVFAVTSDETVEMYDPREDGRWESMVNMRDQEYRSGVYLEGSVVHEGKMYIPRWDSGCGITTIPMGASSGKEAAMTTNLELFVNEELVPSDHWRDIKMFVWHEKLSIVCIYTHEVVDEPYLEVAIWQRDEDTGAWKVLWTMPTELVDNLSRSWLSCEGFFDCDDSDLEWQGIEVNGQYCVVKNQNALICDMMTGLWWELPPLAPSDKATSPWGFMMQRSLDIVT